MTNTFFTSDLHISHKLVSGIRGFGEPVDAAEREWDTVHTDQHDATLARNWDAVVQPEDTVYILGDLSINSGPQVAEWISQRPGTKHLISGNHDRSHTAIFRKYAADKIAEWSPLFESIQDEAYLTIGGKLVTLSHFPSFEWGDGPGRPTFRYQQFRPWVIPGETVILHGHTHGAETAHGREFHVGVDAHNLSPVPLSTIEAWIATLD